MFKQFRTHSPSREANHRQMKDKNYTHTVVVLCHHSTNHMIHALVISCQLPSSCQRRYKGGTRRYKGGRNTSCHRAGSCLESSPQCCPWQRVDITSLCAKCCPMASWPNKLSEAGPFSNCPFSKQEQDKASEHQNALSSVKVHGREAHSNYDLVSKHKATMPLILSAGCRPASSTRTTCRRPS
jgi:hypothetical protein